MASRQLSRFFGWDYVVAFDNVGLFSVPAPPYAPLRTAGFFWFLQHIVAFRPAKLAEMVLRCRVKAVLETNLGRGRVTLTPRVAACRALARCAVNVAMHLTPMLVNIGKCQGSYDRSGLFEQSSNPPIASAQQENRDAGKHGHRLNPTSAFTAVPRDFCTANSRDR